MATKRSKQGVILAAVVSAVVLGSLVMLFAVPPERVDATSEDGLWRLRGDALSPEAFAIIRRDDLPGPFTAVIGPAYELDVPPQPLPAPLLLTAARPEGASAGTSLLSFDESLSVWHARPAAPLYEGELLSAEVFPSSADRLWGAGHVPVRERPDDVEEIIGDLVSRPPAGAVGYAAFLALATVSDDYVVIDQGLAFGGCGGTFRAGDGRALSARDILAEGETFRVGVAWEIAEGCTQGKEMAPAR